MENQSKTASFPQWIQVRLAAPGPLAEAAGDFLVNLTGRGVETREAPEAGGLAEVVGFLEDGPGARAQKAAMERLAADLRRSAGGERVSLEFRVLPGRDWGANWKKHFHPREVAPGLWVGPVWDPPAPEPGRTVVLIDPGQAFGTGQHQSTTLCLVRLVALARAGALPDRALDVGCGTGILSLAALRYGVGRVLAIDIDPEALGAARLNAEHNGLTQGLEISGRPLARVEGRFPLIMANLTAGDLAELAPELAAHLAPGGELMASGVLREQADEAARVMARHGLREKARERDGEWVMLVLS